MSNLDELVTELETIIEAVGRDDLENTLTRLEALIFDLESYQHPRTAFRARNTVPRPRAATPLRRRPALRARLGRTATA